MQYRSASSALKLFTPSLQRTLGSSPAYALEVFDLFGPWLAHVGPTITATERNGNEATVYIRAQVAQSSGQAVTQMGDMYVGLALVRSHGAWKISDDSFFQGQSAVLARANQSSGVTSPPASTGTSAASATTHSTSTR